MEKIKQALDRARDNRISKTSLDKDRVVMSKDPESDFTSNITYTKTKSVELSQHNLREKRVIIGDINDSVSDQYKVLRTHVLQKLKANQ
ncbi:MAG: hypothetical protein JAZ17_19040, partial [Candidatus Thiodiazotropha endolucinida]|nr:hypothetical protein [Candidatus Thiodiazotropha endolucinida]